MIKSNSGMTLTEALVANVILIVAIYAVMTIFNDTIGSQIFLERGLNFVVARNRIVSHLLDAKTWDPTINASENTMFQCLQNQNLSATGPRNCAGITDAPFNVHALDGTMVFNTLNANFGFTNLGANCTTFQAPPAVGNGTCPLGATVKVTAQCDPADTNCTNPSFLFTSQFLYNSSDTRYPLNIQPFNFSYVGSGLFCPNQATPIDLAGDGQISATSTTVFGKSMATQDGHYASTQTPMLPCRNVGMDFVVTGPNYDPAKVGNQTTVCIADATTGACIITFVHKLLVSGMAYELRDGATVVSTQPSWLTLTGNEQFRFEVINGLARFCVEGRCVHYFETKIVAPFRLQIEPGYVTVPGAAMVDGFSASVDEL